MVTQQEKVVIGVTLRWTMDRSASEGRGGGSPKRLRPGRWGGWEGASVGTGTMKAGGAGRFHVFGFQEHGWARESGLRPELNTN